MINFPSFLAGSGMAMVVAAFTLLCETKQESKNMLLVAGLPLTLVGVILLVVFV